jgi:hypothetical protein
MFQHLEAGIGMIIYHSHSALNQQDKVVFYTILTQRLIKIKIFMLLVICMITMLLLLQWLLFLVEGYVILTLLFLFFSVLAFVIFVSYFSKDNVFLFSKKRKEKLNSYCIDIVGESIGYIHSKFRSICHIIIIFLDNIIKLIKLNQIIIFLIELNQMIYYYVNFFNIIWILWLHYIDVLITINVPIVDT